MECPGIQESRFQKKDWPVVRNFTDIEHETTDLFMLAEKFSPWNCTVPFLCIRP